MCGLNAGPWLTIREWPLVCYLIPMFSKISKPSCLKFLSSVSLTLTGFSGLLSWLSPLPLPFWQTQWTHLCLSRTLLSSWKDLFSRLLWHLELLLVFLVHWLLTIVLRAGSFLLWSQGAAMSPLLRLYPDRHLFRTTLLSCLHLWAHNFSSRPLTGSFHRAQGCLRIQLDAPWHLLFKTTTWDYDLLPSFRVPPPSDMTPGYAC